MNNATHRIALIAGGTGLVGRELLEQLLDDPSYERVIAVVRRPMQRTHPKLLQAQLDFDALGHQLTLKLGSQTANDVFCALGTTLKQAGSREAFARVDAEYVGALARAGRALGADRFFLVSAVGSSESSSVFYSRVKGRAESLVAKAGYPTTHIFRPSILLGTHDSRPLEALAIKLTRPLNGLLAGPLERYRGIEPRQVAAAMVGAARQSESGHHIHHFREMQRLSQGAAAGDPSS